jgi:predicted nucleic acid-binding protein
VIHLDTNFLIQGMVPGSRESRLLRGWVREGTRIGMSAVSWSEFLCGPLDADQMELVRALIQDLTPFVPEDAEVAARFFNLSGRRRGSFVDCMIAATAMRVDSALATSDRAAFRKLETLGVKLYTADG